MTDITTTRGSTAQDDPNEDSQTGPDIVPIGLPSIEFCTWAANASTPSLVETLRDRLEHLSWSINEIDRSADFVNPAVLEAMNGAFWGIYEAAPEIMHLQDALCRRSGGMSHTYAADPLTEDTVAPAASDSAKFFAQE